MKTNLTQSGFTLAELAVVLVIVGLLLGGLFIPLSAQTDIRYRSDTEKALADIKEALIGFAIVNGRLPCPADRTIVTATTNAGIEATTGSGSTLTCACTTTTSGIAAFGATACDDASHGSAVGVVPWATLGLPETDAWGNHFSYRVTLQFARGATGQSTFYNHANSATCTPSANPTSSAFALCSDGDITISSSSGGATLANQIPAIAVSHGKNGYGAWNTSGSQNDSSSAATDELENSDGDPYFVSSTGIDDQLAWVPPTLLMNRMIAAGKLP